MEPSNDGGIVVVLFLMVAALAYALNSAVAIYERSTRSDNDTRIDINARFLRLLSGSANLGNSFIHILLGIYILVNTNNNSEYWVEERKLGGMEGPVGVGIFNLLASLTALRGYGMKLSIGWNTFAAVMGIFVPIVWPRFLEVGLASWPYTVVFLWFAIFAMELTALTCSLVYFAIGDSNKTKSE